MKEALKLTLEALRMPSNYWNKTQFIKVNEAIAAAEEALAQPEQEPVAWGVFEGNLHDMFFTESEAVDMAQLKGDHAEVKPLYTTPPQRTWVGLTDEEMNEWIEEEHDVLQWAEAKLKEKNHGE